MHDDDRRGSVVLELFNASRGYSLLLLSFSIFRIHLPWLIRLQFSRKNYTNTPD